jgi:hypothetical protein
MAALDQAPVEAGTQQAWSLPSRTGGQGHMVRLRVGKDGERYLTCSCPGGRHAYAGQGPTVGRGCWAMQAVRAALGMPPIGRPTL